MRRLRAPETEAQRAGPLACPLRRAGYDLCRSWRAVGLMHTVHVEGLAGKQLPPAAEPAAIDIMRGSMLAPHKRSWTEDVLKLRGVRRSQYWSLMTNISGSGNGVIRMS